MAGGGITAEGLVKTFQGKTQVRALDGVSLQVEPGTVLGLLGPNGAGKTTTVRVLTTLLVPDSWSAVIDGIDVIREPDRVRKSIGLAGQYAAVDDTLTGRENLEITGRLNHLSRNDCRTRAGQLLEQFGLADAGDRQAKTYSGGMRRRLDLAAALVASPPVLFLDEPTTGLDPASRSTLWDVVDALVADGTTVLLTTQYLEEADRLANRIAVVDQGRVIAEGTSVELKARLGGTVVEVHLADGATATRAAELLDGAGDATARDGDAVRVTAAEGTLALTEVVRRLDRDGIVATRVLVHEPSLDDVFLSLTGHAAGSSPEGDAA